VVARRDLRPGAWDPAGELELRPRRPHRGWRRDLRPGATGGIRGLPRPAVGAGASGAPSSLPLVLATRQELDLLATSCERAAQIRATSCAPGG
jgi:hypothetical protein